MVKVLNCGFGNIPKIRRLADPVPLTLDPSNPKSIGFNRLSRTTTVPSHSEHGFSFYRTNIHPTHTHTHRDKVIAISAPPGTILKNKTYHVSPVNHA